jgi:diadenosine tetraphosphate (Ap4A) HIT family hydrolase/pimeloyl-ACP methyl ester carboxylesterase
MAGMIPLVAPLIAACAPWGVPPAKVPDAVVLGKAYDDQNPFAKIVRGQNRMPVVYEDRNVIAFMDYEPATPGHVLVISKTSRARNLLEMNDKDLARLMKVVRRVGRAEISGLGADGFTVEQNNGLPQSVPHLHIHILPRYVGYNRCRGGGLRQTNEVLEPFAARLRAAMAADRGEAVPPKPADDLPPPANLVPQNTPVVPPKAVTADPPADPANPPAMVAFQLPSHGALLNAVMYTASGAGPHPTMLLLHGFPGNEQNLDLAQAVRRAGWNVLTFHYRGSWASPGAFSFAHAAEDADAALAFLKSREAVVRFRIDPARIVVAGHSMGGMMAAHAAAGDKAILGAILIDAWDIASDGRRVADDPKAKDEMVRDELRGDLPPLAGTNEAALVDEIVHAPPSLDLAVTAAQLKDMSLMVIGAERAGAPTAQKIADAARGAGGKHIALVIVPTDHSFSDHRIELESRVIDWLGQFPR